MHFYVSSNDFTEAVKNGAPYKLIISDLGTTQQIEYFDAEKWELVRENIKVRWRKQ